jgi:hypothetical protein
MTVTLVFISEKNRLSIHKETKIIHWISDLPTMEHNFLFESRLLLTVQNRLSSLDAMKGGFIGSLMVVIPALPNRIDSSFAGQTAESLSVAFYVRQHEIRKKAIAHSGQLSYVAQPALAR